VKKDEVKMTN